MALAVYLPSLGRASAKEQAKWFGFQIHEADLCKDPDPRFQLWVARYFEGDWDVDNGVLMRLGQVIRELNALCECAVGVPLFKCQDLGGLHFPVAENNHRFVDAHAEAYKHIVDELDKVAIKRIGLKCGKLLNLDSDRTLNALEKVLPSPMAKKVLEPLKKVAEQRRLAGHGARPNAKKFPAFERFNQDMTEVLNGLQGLETFLSQLFQVDPDSCVKRVEAMRRLPRLDASRPAQPNYSIWQIASARGKRISKVEFGYQEPVEGCHDREMFVLHFDDDSMLAVTTGSNAMDVSSKFEGLEPSDFHVDFVLTEVPTLKSK